MYNLLARSEISCEGSPLTEDSVIDDWNHATKLLGAAQEMVWEYTVGNAAALQLVSNVAPNSTAKLKLIQDFAVEQGKDADLKFSMFMLKKSKFTNVLQPLANNLSGGHVFKLTAPIQKYFLPNEQGSQQRQSATNEAMNQVSLKMQYSLYRTS